MCRRAPFGKPFARVGHEIRLALLVIGHLALQEVRDRWTIDMIVQRLDAPSAGDLRIRSRRPLSTRLCKRSSSAAVLRSVRSFELRLRYRLRRRKETRVAWRSGECTEGVRIIDRSPCEAAEPRVTGQIANSADVYAAPLLTCND